MGIKLVDVNVGDFKAIPDGVQNMRIKKVTYDAKAASLSLLYETENGETDFENYYFRDNNGKQNEKALRHFSFVAKTLLGANKVEVEPEELEGVFVEAEVSHNEYTNDDGKTKTYANFSNFKKGTPFKVSKPKAQNKTEEPAVEESDDGLDWLDF